MPRPKPDPDMVAHALQELAKGRTTAEVAAEISAVAGKRISPSAVQRWREQAAQPSVPPVHRAPGLASHLAAKREAEEEAKAKAPPPPEVDTSDTLGTLRTLAAGMLKESHEARLSNPKLSATLAKNAADIMNTVMRGEKARADDVSTLRISRAEIEETAKALRERIKALTSGEAPLCCSACGRALRIAWGEAGEKVAAAMKGGT